MPASTLSSSREDDYASNRIAIVKIVSNIGRRGIPRRGDGDGNNSNFTQIFHLRTENNPAISTWLVTKHIAKRDTESNGTRSSQRCRTFAPQ